MKNTLWDKIEAKLTELFAKNNPAPANASAADTATTAKSIADLKAEFETAKKDFEAKDKQISELTAKVADQTKTIEGHVKKITDLEAAAKTAGEQAADLIASTGVDPENLPKQPAPKAGSGAEQKSLRQQYEALLATDSVKAAEFYAQHGDKKDFWK